MLISSEIKFQRRFVSFWPSNQNERKAKFLFHLQNWKWWRWHDESPFRGNKSLKKYSKYRSRPCSCREVWNKYLVSTTNLAKVHSYGVYKYLYEWCHQILSRACQDCLKISLLINTNDTFIRSSPPSCYRVSS